MKTRYFPVFLTILAGILLAQTALADDAADAANRIKQRLAQVDAMKAAAEIGETADGYLEERQSLSGRKASVVAAENADRQLIYASVAKRTGQTIGEVGQQRALQIAKRARAGVWLQKLSGEWYQKP